MEEKFPEAFAQFKEGWRNVLKNTIEICRIWSLLLNMVTLHVCRHVMVREPQAPMKIACDLVDEGMRTEEEQCYD